MKDQAAKIPQLKKNWYVFHSRMRTWVKEGNGKPFRPYAFVAIDFASQYILNFEILPEEPSAEKILELIVQTITAPKMDRFPKHRPQTIKFEDKQLAGELAEPLAGLEIQAKYAPYHKISGSILRDLTSQFAENHPEILGISSKAGINLSMKKGFYQAAADFFRAEPWVYLENEEILRIHIPPQDPYYVVVMGNAGMEYGLIVFKELDDLEKYFKMDEPIDSRIPESGWHALNFDEIYDISFDDLDEIERHNFEIAAENAYPAPITYFKNRTYQIPSRDMIVWYQAAMQAITQFTQEILKTGKASPTKQTSYKFPVEIRQTQIEAEILFPSGVGPQKSTMHPLGQGSILETTGFGNSGMEDPKQIEAQEIIYDAWEESAPEEKIALAWDALEIDPLCADAYVLLADNLANTDQEKLDFYQKGVEAGAKRLGQAFFEENSGHFWGIIETRPYMRALHGVGNAHWVMKDYPKAEKVFRKMLTLNPGDNQGIRFLLAQMLLDAEKYRPAEKLIKEYDDYNAYSLFTHALLMYQKNGPGNKADRLLTEADEYNPFVKNYLTGDKKIPHRSPNTYSMGDENEAVVYAEAHLNHWRKVPGAVGWLRKTLLA